MNNQNKFKLKLQGVFISTFLLTLVNIYFAIDSLDTHSATYIVYPLLAVYFSITCVLLIIARKNLLNNYKDFKVGNWFAKMMAFYVVFLLIAISISSLCTPFQMVDNISFKDNLAGGTLAYNALISLAIAIWFIVRVEKYIIKNLKPEAEFAQELFLQKFGNQEVTSEYELSVNRKSYGLNFQFYRRNIAIVNHSTLVIKQDPLIIVPKENIESIEVTPVPFFGLPYILLRTKDNQEYKLSFHEYPPGKYGVNAYRKSYPRRLAELLQKFRKDLNMG